MLTIPAEILLPASIHTCGSGIGILLRITLQDINTDLNRSLKLMKININTINQC